MKYEPGTGPAYKRAIAFLKKLEEDAGVPVHGALQASLIAEANSIDARTPVPEEEPGFEPSVKARTLAEHRGELWLLLQEVDEFVKRRIYRAVKREREALARLIQDR